MTTLNKLALSAALLAVADRLQFWRESDQNRSNVEMSLQGQLEALNASKTETESYLATVSANLEEANNQLIALSETNDLLNAAINTFSANVATYPDLVLEHLNVLVAALESAGEEIVAVTYLYSEAAIANQEHALGTVHYTNAASDENWVTLSAGNKILNSSLKAESEMDLSMSLDCIITCKMNVTEGVVLVNGVPASDSERVTEIDGNTIYISVTKDIPLIIGTEGTTAHHTLEMLVPHIAELAERTIG
jgi:hypothetical protein